MYSVSRHLVTFQGSSCLRQVCGENGVKVVKRLLSCASGGGNCHVGIRGRHLAGAWRQFGNGNEVKVKQFGSCRYYSKSAEKAVAKEEASSLGEGQGENEERTEVMSSSEEHQEDKMDAYEDDEGLHLTDEEIQELTRGDPELIKKIKYIQLEYSVMRQDGEQVPSASMVKFKHWKELLPLGSRSKRKKYYLYLFKTEMTILSQERKKQEQREARLKMYAENPMPSKEEDPIGTFYGLNRNTLFLRLYDATVNKYFHCRAASAMLHHPPLVLDCSYDGLMSHREAKNCAKQIELAITDNRTHREPFNLYLCNAWRDTKTMDFLQRMIPTIDCDDFAVNLHEDCFTDVLPKERLVYLTPHTRDELEEYNEDDIYIIGAMVDKTDVRPHSLAKAKRLNLRMKRLPLDQHLMWGMGGKSLTINQMVRIMLDLRYTRGDWKTALKHVPMRKLCRDFHPYPDQEGNNQQQESADTSRLQPTRRERKTHVMEDFELLNSRRKGFRRSEYYDKAPPPPRRSHQAVQAPRIKSLFHDDN